MVSGSVWAEWILLFIGGAIPFNRLLPWLSSQLSALSDTLDKPSTRCRRFSDPSISLWVTGVAVIKGLVAGFVAFNSGLPEWGQIATLAIVLIGHSWTIFSEGSHPSPFWVIVGIFAAFHPSFAVTYLILFLVATLIVNLPHIGMIVATGITALMVVSNGLAPDILTPSLLGLLTLTISARLLSIFDDVPPTLWGLYVQRK